MRATRDVVEALIRNLEREDTYRHTLLTVLRGYLETMRTLPEVRLTPRQGIVLGLVSQGLSNIEIAQTLGISRTTARRHVSDLIQKYDARSRAGLAVKVMEKERCG